MRKEESLQELAHPEYWDARYSKDNAEAKVYDWLRQFKTIQSFLVKHLPAASAEPKILHLGSGNSSLPIDLDSQCSYHHQTAVDFSPVVIQHMRAQHPRITWLEMDIRALQFEDAAFDVCIDKATLDAMLFGSLWDPADEVRENVSRYVDEVARVLRQGGVWLYVTWRQPHFMRPLLAREGVWEVQCESLVREGEAGMLEYFGFVMRKL